MPVHNRFTLVDEAIRSVYEQTHRPIELIIVDDLSEELYLANISSEPGFEVKIIRHDENKGPGASRETGRLAAHGDFIAYLDSDDLWHPEKLQKQVATLQAHPEAGMCYCISTEFSQLLNTGLEKIRKRSNTKYHEFLPTVLNGRPWDTSSCLWTRKASDVIGPWFAGWTWEDYEYDFRAGCKNILICNIPEVLCHYRTDYGGQQLSRSDRKSQMLNRTKSIVKMHMDLQESDKVNDAVILDRFLKTVYFQAMHLFYLEEKKIGLVLIDIVFQSSKRKVRWFANLIKILSPFLSSASLGDLLYKYRNNFWHYSEILGF